MKQIKQQVQAAKTAPSAPRPEHSLRFIALIDQRLVDGIDIIRPVLEQKSFITDHFEYKISTKTEIKRAINPKNPSGPSEKVTIEEKVNINSSLKAIRQLAWRVSKDPENVLLVQAKRTKGESNALPLIFPRLLKEDRDIFVTGATKMIQAQLCSKPDLNFQSIPAEVESYPALKTELIQRSNRKKGMQATCRELLDTPGIKGIIYQKINDVALGKAGVELSHAEAINIILLSDLYTRYFALLQGFFDDVSTKRMPPGALGKLFTELLSNVRVTQLESRLGDYLDEEKDYKTHEQIFAGVYVTLQTIEAGKAKGDPNIFNKNTVYSRIKALFLLSRSQVDPALWKKCTYFHLPGDDETDLKVNIAHLAQMADRLHDRLANVQASSSKSLQDIYMIHNLNGFLKKRPFWISDKLPTQDRNTFISTAAASMGITLSPKQLPGHTVDLFSEEKPKVALRYQSVRSLSASYGYLHNSILLDSLDKFLEPGKENLFQRFGRDFFDILYFKLVKNPCFQISRTKLGNWLDAHKIIPRLNEKGFTQGDQDPDFEPLLTQEILNGSGHSLFDKKYTAKDFQTKLELSQKTYQNFTNKLIHTARSTKGDFNTAALFLQFMEGGNLQFRSPSFRKFAKKTFLYDELQEIITNSCNDIIGDIERKAINKKFILHIPETIADLLFIGNEFILKGGKHHIKVHILSLPVTKADAFPAISQSFCGQLMRYLKGGTSEEKKALLLALQFLGEFAKTSKEYFRSLSIIFLDQVIHQSLAFENERDKTTPAHLKYFFPDRHKLILGSLKNTQYTKLMNFAGMNLSKPVDPDNQSLGQVLQGIHYYHTAKKSIYDLDQVLDKILSLLDRFAEPLKEKEEFKSYSHLTRQIQKIIEAPIEDFTQSKLQLLQKFALKIKKLADNSILPKGIIAQLTSEWKRLYPNLDRKIKFYQLFLGDSNSKENLMLELKHARDCLITFQQKKAIIYYPPIGKPAQFEQLEEAVLFGRKINPSLVFYVETTGVGEAQLEDLAKIFDPRKYFQSTKIEPIMNPAFTGKLSE